MSGELTGLLERVRAATGPDREIDFAIYRISGNKVTNEANLSPTSVRGHLEAFTPYYTYSLTDIVALIKAKLPGWNLAVWIDDEPQVSIYPKVQPFPVHMDIYEYNAVPTLALCAAFLAALSAQEDKL